MTTTEAHQPRYGNLVAAIGTVAACDIAMGLTLQLLPLLMERDGHPAWLIGLNAAMGPIGILLTGPFLPRIIGNFGPRRAVITVTVIMILLLIGLKLSPSVWWWFPLRFMFGVAAGTLFTVSEAWVLTFAGDGNRGRVMGVYTSVLAITFSMGPLIIPWTGIDGWWPWLICIACIAISSLPLAFVKADDGVFRQERKGGFFRFVAKAPLLLFAVGAATLFDNVFIAFFTIFGMRNGVELETASYILGVGIIGNVFLFYPMGWLADHWSRSGVIAVTASLAVVLSLSLIVLIGTPLIWGAIILLTASAFGVYVVALATLGDSFQGPDLIAGSAAFGMMWGVGGLIGPPLAGLAIDTFGINAMPVTLASFYVILLVGFARNGGRLVRTQPRG